jgi:hypothetical protein
MKRKYHTHNNTNPKDQVNFQSDDGLVEVVTKVDQARRDPAHKYPIVCLRLRPEPGTRVQAIGDGSDGLDVLLRHSEIAAHLTAVNEADPKANYQFEPIPEKAATRKAYWDRINRARWNRNRKL